MFANVVDKLYTVLSILKDISSVKAFFNWPKFSVTSYQMVSCLAKQGILPKTVIDVGANVGQFTVATSKIFGDVKVYSFEPIPACVERLKENVSSINNIVVYPFALGESETEVKFYVNSHSQSSSALTLAPTHHDAFPDEKEREEITVKVSTLDLVFSNIELQHPVLLKLDVQGYEAQVLLGGKATLKRVDYVILETSFKTMYKGELLFNDILQMMEANGFQLDRPVGWLTDPRNGEVLQMDALFVRLS